MKRFIQGEDRTQATMFPELLDNYVAETNPVRVVDVFVDELDLGQLGFEGVDPAGTGRPAYHPAVLLKIYIYGYLTRIQSSRRLEREAQRNVELMWLTGRLMPDFKTIANFRKDNGKAIRSVCRQFVVLCQRLGLFTDALVAIDGSKFKAVNNRDRNFTSAKLKRRMEEIESSINRYLAAIETADRQEASIAEDRTERLQDKIEALKNQMRELKEVEVKLDETPDKQISLTDPDARSMKTRGNVKSEEIQASHEAGINVFVAKTETSSATADGRFGKDDFIYDAERDEYRCPAGEILARHSKMNANGLSYHRNWSSNCNSCPMKSQCTPGQERRVTRWEHEYLLDAMQERLDHSPDIMRIRRETVEHPFGTIKFWMGAAHFLTATLEHVSSEMSLHVLAYNMKRVMKILGTAGLIQAMRA